VPEEGIMTIPPRNPATDKLFSGPLLSYAYLQMGIIEALLCLFVYFQVR
jgi:hypothetical protein